MRRYTITMNDLTLCSRKIRLVAFQHADGTYPTSADEVTTNTWAVCYSSTSKDNRCYVGSFAVGNIVEIYNELERRRYKH